MIYKKFNLLLIFRFVLILSNFISIGITYNLGYITLPMALVTIAIIQVIEITFFINATNRSLIKFLQDVNFQDLSAGYSIHKYGGSFAELELTYKRILNKMKTISHEKEAYLELLNSIVDQIDIGLIVIEKNGNVRLMNSVASSFLGVANFKKWERFKERIPDFTDFIDSLDTGETSIFKLNTLENQLSLSITKTQLIQLKVELNIITIVSIGGHLGKKEVESYDRLISVLTHEIMNTITPIVSLSKIVEEKLENTTDLDLKESSKIISERSEGLLRFVKSYRKISKIPEPELEYYQIKPILNSIANLMYQNLNDDEIIEIKCTPETLEIQFDKTLLEQCLINLIKNSIEAKSDKRTLRIKLIVSQRAGKKVIDIIDNGNGVPEEINKQILIPFYTSKEEGSGIGLSMVNQIMIKHKGHLQFDSNFEGSIFTLIFNN